MIKLNTAAFVAISNDQQTQKKIDRAIVLYHTPQKGKVQSWLRLERKTADAVVVDEEVVTPEQFEEVSNELIKMHNQDDFIGVDILQTLSTAYQSELQTLNPSLTFTIV